MGQELRKREEDEQERLARRRRPFRRLERVGRDILRAYFSIGSLSSPKLHNLIGLGLGAAPMIALLLVINKFVTITNPVVYGLMMIGGAAMGALGVRMAHTYEKKHYPLQARIRKIEERYLADLEAVEVANLPEEEAAHRRGLALDKRDSSIQQALEAETQKNEQRRLPRAPEDPKVDAGPDPE